MDFGPSNARKPFQGMDCLRDNVAKKGMAAELANCVTSWKGVNGLLKGLCSREGKDGDGFFVITSSRWNQMHIGSVTWNNESIIVQLREKLV